VIDLSCLSVTSVPAGGRIILACRDLKRAQAAVDDIRKQTSGIEGLGELVITHLDLSSLASVRDCAQYLLRTEKHIHLLINNAGKSHDDRRSRPDACKNATGREYNFTRCYNKYVIGCTARHCCHMADTFILLCFDSLFYTGANYYRIRGFRRLKGAIEVSLRRC
jgi:hypothetical protein